MALVLLGRAESKQAVPKKDLVVDQIDDGDSKWDIARV